MPTSTAAPLRFISEIACSAAPATPTVTNTKSALAPPVISATRAATSSRLGVDRMRRAERLRRVELGVDDVDGDDRRGAGDPRALHGIEPDAAAADDDDARGRRRTPAVLTTAP